MHDSELPSSCIDLGGNATQHRRLHIMGRHGCRLHVLLRQRSVDIVVPSLLLSGCYSHCILWFVAIQRAGAPNQEFTMINWRLTLAILTKCEYQPGWLSYCLMNSHAMAMQIAWAVMASLVTATYHIQIRSVSNFHFQSAWCLLWYTRRRFQWSSGAAQSFSQVWLLL